MTLGFLPGDAEAARLQVVAYIDPGAGSFLLQALVAAMAGIIVTVSAHWQKIKALLGMPTKSSDSDDGSPPTPDE